MNELNDYLARLGQDLKLLSPSEQDEILAEIESHIEEGLEDPRMYCFSYFFANREFL